MFSESESSSKKGSLVYHINQENYFVLPALSDRDVTSAETTLGLCAQPSGTSQQEALFFFSL